MMLCKIVIIIIGKCVRKGLIINLALFLAQICSAAFKNLHRSGSLMCKGGGCSMLKEYAPFGVMDGGDGLPCGQLNMMLPKKAAWYWPKCVLRSG